jgi:hypothetical protein
MDGFLGVVQEAWTAQPGEPCPFKRLYLKLRATTKRLASWSSKFIGSVKMQILMATELILRFDVAMESRALSPEERALRRLLKKKLMGLASLERTIARQRSRILWLQEGDACTRFFHLHASHRRRKNFIGHLMVNEVRITEHADKAEAVDSFFDDLLGFGADRPFTLDLDYLGFLPLASSTSMVSSPRRKCGKQSRICLWTSAQGLTDSRHAFLWYAGTSSKKISWTPSIPCRDLTVVDSVPSMEP